jgi:rubrerythrin
MRVRPNRKPTESRRRSSALRRRQPAERTEPSSPPPEEVDLSDERRARESGGPEDRAMYTCTCGYVFEAEVSTSVACPHCGAAQAW